MLLEEMIDTVDIAWSILGKEIKICELGDQRMKWHKDLIAKTFFLNNGAKEHISIDLNGRNGALKIDLGKNVLIDNPTWRGYFDLVTNYGTAEHVQDGIYECYKNIHNFCMTGGIMINDGPPDTCCPWHSPYHYKSNFFPELARLCEYKTILLDKRVCKGRRGASPCDSTLVVVVFQKIKDSEFITKEEFYSIKGIKGL